MSSCTEQQQANVDLVLASYNAYLEGDPEKSQSYLSEDFDASFFNPPAAPERTQGDTKALVPWVWESVGLPDLDKNIAEYDEALDVHHYEIVETLPLGDDRVYMLAFYRATVKATGKSFHCNSSKIFVIKDGKIVKRDTSFDIADMAAAFRED